MGLFNFLFGSSDDTNHSSSDNGFTSKIIEKNNTEKSIYRSDMYVIEKSTGDHIHDWYDVKKDGTVDSGACITTTNGFGDKEHIPCEKIR